MKEEVLFRANNFPIIKKYIVPLDQIEFELEEFLKKYLSVSNKEDKLEYYTTKIEELQLKQMMKTNLMAFMIMEVLPILQEKQIKKINLFNLYEEFIKKNISNEIHIIGSNKYSEDKIMEFGNVISKYMHKYSKVDNFHPIYN